MNLSQLVDYVCTQVQMVGTDDRTACKMFLSKQYELIYNSYLWKDSLVMVNVTVDPEDANNAEGVVLLPEVIDRVVAVRTADQSVRVRGLEDFYRIDFDKFNETGRPYEFSILSPVWFIWRGWVGLETVISTGMAKITWRDTAGIRHVDTADMTDVNLLQDSPAGGLVVSGAGTSEANGTFSYGDEGDGVYYYRKNSTTAIGLEIISPTLQRWSIIVSGLPKYQMELSGDSSVLQVPVGTWTRVFSGDAPAPTSERSADSRIEIESVFKPSGGTFELDPQFDDEDAGGTIAATATRSPSYQRIRLFNIPDVETTLKVLGKKKFVPLDFAEEEPEIKNLDNCLIAFACGAMWKRRRQMAKAMEEMKIGVALLGELAKLETIQASHNSRFIPDGGAGDVFFGPGRSGGLWI
jgi:hypothetical protein